MDHGLRHLVVNRADWLGFRFTVDGAMATDIALATLDRAKELNEADFKTMARAHSGAMADVVAKYVQILRDDIAGGGFYAAVRLSRTWHGRKYPNKDTIEPAGYFWNKAGTIVDAFTLGVTITVRNRKFLAIPQGPAKAILRRYLRSVATSRRDSGLGRDDEGRYSELGGPVAIVAAALGLPKLDVRLDPKTQRGVIVAPGRRFTRSGKAARGRGDDTVLFALTKQSRLRARIEGRKLVERLQKSFEGDFVAALIDELGPEASTHAPTPLRGR
jgi:hypothetical protein